MQTTPPQTLGHWELTGHPTGLHQASTLGRWLQWAFAKVDKEANGLKLAQWYIRL